MVYREQVYREPVRVEPCACNAPSTGPCDVCGRPWCADHREGALCIRCAHAIGHELEPLRSRPLIVATATEVVATVGLLLAHTMVGVFLGVPLAVVAYFATKRLSRRWVIARMAPRLALTTGEIYQPREPATSGGSSAVPVPGMQSYH